MAIHIDILARLRQRDVDRAADQMATSFENAATRAGDNIERNITRGAQRAAISLERQTNRVADAQERVNRLKAEYNNMATRSDVDDNKIIKIKERTADAERTLAKAMRDRALAQRAANSLTDEAVEGLAKIDRGARDAAGSLGQLGKNSFSVGRGGLIAGMLPLVPMLIDTAKVATTATQSIYLLPAALTAAAVGFGTLKLATMGFGDAMDNLEDPEKFAQALAKLSPNAQQAALSIRQLLPELKGLKNATQDALFDGLGGEFERLSSVYLPQIERLTTSVAGTFNQMAKNLSNQFLTPDMQANFSVIGTNIAQTFQNLAPAATSLSQAFVDITATGSSFLPQLATDISNAATEFANFISEARQSGQLAEWIREGIDAVKLLGDAIWTLGDFIYDTFGANGQQNINDFKDTLSGVQSVLNALSGDFGTFNDTLNNGEGWTLGADIREELDLMTGVAAKFRDAIYNIPESFRALSNSAIDMANAVTNALNKGPIAAINALIGGTTKLYNMLPGADRPEDIGKIGEIPKIDNLPNEPYKPWNTLPQNTPGGAYSNDRYTGPTDPTLAGPREWTDPKTGVVMVPGPAGVGGWVPKSSVPQPSTPGGPYAVPAPPPTDANGKKLSDSDLQRIARENLDPSSYKVDPFAAIPGMPAVGARPGVPGAGTTGLTLGQMLGGASGAGVGGPMPGGGYGAVVDPVGVYEQQHEVISKAHDLEESNKALLAAQKDGVSTAEDIQKAKWKQQEDEFALWKSQQDLVDKMRGTTRNAKSGTDQLGVALDPDLGLGQGLSGFAENITKMFGNIIARPFMEQMQAQVDADPIKGGFGLLGINGAKNIANGVSPLLGRSYDGAGYASAAFGGTGASGITSAGGYPGDAALLANVPRGKGKYDQGTKDLSQGLVDCASGVEDLVNIMDGKSTVGGSLWTGNAATVLPGMGFQRGMGGPGDFRIGYNSAHMQATLPQGTNVNYGSTGAIQAGGLDGGQGAYDPAFTDHWFRPAGAGPMGGAGGTAAAGMGMGSGGATPVFVVNMPGGGMGIGGFPVGSPASGQGSGPAPGPGGGSGFNWDAIAGAEASGNWANKSNPKYQGGLQFDPSTWAKVKPADAPANAADASREQQIAGAEALMKTGATAASQWPATFKAHPEWFGGGGGGDLFGPANTGMGLNNPPPPLGDPADLFTGGGGQGPIFKKSPGTDMSSLDPNSPTGAGGFSPTMPGAAPTGLGMGGIDPYSPIGATGAPGTIGPFAVPPSVQAAAPGGIGNSSMMPLANGGGTAGWQPNVGPAPLQPSMTPTTYGGVGTGATPAMGGTGGIGASDTTMALATTAASALDVMAPGAGQAAATGMKLANRAIQYGSQLAGIGISGLMETFLPTGGSELAQGGWIPRIVGGIAGAKPALPNVAGGPGGGQQPQPPLTPQQASAHAPNGKGDPGPGNQINVEYNSVGQTEDRNGADLTHQLSNLQTGGMAGMP